MAYVDPNFKTKKALREAVQAGRLVTVYEPGLGSCLRDGEVTVEGPHYPQPHTWYATAVVKDGVVVAVR